MACDRRLTTLRYGRDHYVSRLPRHTPRLSSLASVAHPSLHPLVPEARRRRGEGTRGGGRKGRRDGPLHITYSTRSADPCPLALPPPLFAPFPTVPSLREVRRTRVVNVGNILPVTISYYFLLILPLPYQDSLSWPNTISPYSYTSDRTYIRPRKRRRLRPSPVDITYRSPYSFPSYTLIPLRSWNRRVRNR